MSWEEPAALWTCAVEHHLAGRFGDAETLYQQLLSIDFRNADAMHMLGVLQFQRGCGHAALEWIDQAIGRDERVPSYHGHHGLILASLGRLEEATAAYRRALALAPEQADTLTNLGNALWAMGDRSGAIAAYRQALAAQPEMPESAANLGWALLKTGALEEAILVLEQALTLHPGNHTLIEHLSVTQNNLGAALLQQRDAQQALTLFRKALALKPAFVEAHFNAGKALAHLQQNDAAIACYRQAIALKPDYAEVYNDLGIALYASGRMDEAITSYREALRLDPDYSQACNNLGNALRKCGQLSESVVSYRQALLLDPGNPEIWNNLGSVLSARGDLDEATEALRTALAHRPGLSEAHNNLGNAYKDQGDLDAAITCYARAGAMSHGNQDAHSNRLYTLYFHPDYSLQDLYQQHTDWYMQHAAHLCPERPEFGNDRSPGRRLRVGYVAPFFREHCQSLFTIPLLSHHDHDQMEVFAYSDVPTPDLMTVRLQGLCDTWRNIAGMSDQAVADLIRQDRIDILVDLSLHMAGNRLLVFARKPAPVQVTWLGYPGTTGLQTIDYRLTDPFLDPAANDALYTERSLRLPHTFWCYDPLTRLIPITDLPARRNGYVTFGCLNNFCKVNPSTLRLWAGVLRAVPQSRLLLLAPRGQARRWILDTLQQNGVDGSRIAFTDRLPRSQYLALYQGIDIGLDTIPYNGHTTSLDSLWMGVPVVTLVGDAPVGRAGWSQLSNLGLPHLAATSDAQFVQTAVQLSSDPDTLLCLRAELRSRLLQSPLGDAPRFARDIEAAYRQMWDSYCRQGGF